MSPDRNGPRDLSNSVFPCWAAVILFADLFMSLHCSYLGKGFYDSAVWTWIYEGGRATLFMGGCKLEEKEVLQTRCRMCPYRLQQALKASFIHTEQQILEIPQRTLHLV